MGLPAKLSEFFSFNQSIGTDTELPEIFPFKFDINEFIAIDIAAIYTKILTDVVERTHGLTADQSALLWDNCLKSSKNDGLITMLSKAMSDKKDLFIVYMKEIDIVREATSDESQKIKDGYAKKAEKIVVEGGVGIYISFKNYKRSDMLKLLSSLEYAAIGSLYKSMNLSKALQLKMSDLRASVGLDSSADAIAQAKIIAKALGEGKDILLGDKDAIVTATPELDSTKSSIAFLDSKRSFYLGLPASYITGEQTGGIGSTGEGDSKAIERGLKSYFFSIIKPVLEDLFGAKLKFKSSDFRQIDKGLLAIKTFQLVDESMLSLENKKKIVESLFDVDADDNKTAAPKPVGTGTTPPIAPSEDDAGGDA